MENIVVELKRTKGNVHFETTSADHPAIMVPFDYTPPLGSGEIEGTGVITIRPGGE